MGLNQFVVTARRVEENLQRVPVHRRFVVTPEQLTRADVVDINSLQKIVPGYQGGARYVGNTLATSTYRIRGLTGIATYFGDTPVDFSNYGIFFDVENVQALMGPQGTRLFGRASNAGALVITPRAPGNEFGAYVRVEVGDADREVYEGAVDIPLMQDKVMVRVAAKVTSWRGISRTSSPMPGWGRRITMLHV